MCVQNITKLIHFPIIKKKFFNVPLYCRAIRNLTQTPTKDPEPAQRTNDSSSNPSPVAAPLMSKTDIELSGQTDNLKPINEIKSKLFGNLSEDLSDVEDSQDEASHLRDEFLKSDEEYQPAKKERKKRGRKSSNDDSGEKKHKKKVSKSAKLNPNRI